MGEHFYTPCPCKEAPHGVGEHAPEDRLLLAIFGSDEVKIAVDRWTRGGEVTCPTSCAEENHPGREHDDWLVGSPAEPCPAPPGNLCLDTGCHDADRCIAFPPEVTP